MGWRRPVSWMLVLAAAAVAWAAASADTVKTKDGRTLTGVAETIGERVRVTRADGSRVELSKNDVVSIEKTKTPLQEYADRDAGIKANDADGRFQLGLWCERQGLKTEAVRECAKALAIQPDHAGARELMIALIRPGASATGTTTRGSGTATGPMPIPRKNLLTEERAQTRDYFARFVQPVLSDRCAGAQCHGGPPGGRLRLFRSPVSGVPGNDVLLPNFDAIYPYITDFQNPDKCLLLEHPLALTAGGAPSKCKKAFLTKADAGYRVLATLIADPRIGLLLPSGWHKRTEEKPGAGDREPGGP